MRDAVKWDFLALIARKLTLNVKLYGTFKTIVTQ